LYFWGLADSLAVNATIKAKIHFMLYHLCVKLSNKLIPKSKTHIKTLPSPPEKAATLYFEGFWQHLFLN